MVMASSYDTTGSRHRAKKGQPESFDSGWPSRRRRRRECVCRVRYGRLSGGCARRSRKGSRGGSSAARNLRGKRTGRKRSVLRRVRTRDSGAFDTTRKCRIVGPEYYVAASARVRCPLPFLFLTPLDFMNSAAGKELFRNTSDSGKTNAEKPKIFHRESQISSHQGIHRLAAFPPRHPCPPRMMRTSWVRHSINSNASFDGRGSA